MAVTRNVALFNLVVQLVLLVGILVGAYLGRTCKFDRHCLLMRNLMGAHPHIGLLSPGTPLDNQKEII